MVRVKAKATCKISKNFDGNIIKYSFEKDEIREIDDIHLEWLVNTKKIIKL